MSAGLLAAFLVSAGALGASSSPTFTYRYTSFASQSPDAAAKFLIKYMGATPIAAVDADAAAVSTRLERAVRFVFAEGTQHHDVRLVSDSAAPVGAMLPIAEYTATLHDVHRFDVQETWDWFQDWHLCLTVADIDLIAYRLVQDGIPIVTRSSYSFYVEVTPGVTFQILGSKMNLVWSELFSFCRNTTEDNELNMIKRDVREMVIGSIPTPLPAIPELAPSHHSYFSTIPEVQGNWTLAHTSATQFDMNAVWQESHRYSDGRCAVINWLDFTTHPSPIGQAVNLRGWERQRFSQTFQVHYINQFRKKEGRGEGGHAPLRVADVESKLVALHTASFANNTTNAYMDNRAGFEVPHNSLDSIAEGLDADSTPWMWAAASLSSPTSGRALLMLVPGGIVWEVTEAAALPLA